MGQSFYMVFIRSENGNTRTGIGIIQTNFPETAKWGIDEEFRATLSPSTY